MTAHEFQQLAIKSSHIYFDYLGSNHIGGSFTGVSEILRDKHNTNVFRLSLVSSLIAPDSVAIIDNRFPMDNQPKAFVSDYKEINGKFYLYIRLDPDHMDLFATATASEIKVFSDLKFLVKRCENWYLEHGGCLSLPFSCPGISFTGSLSSTVNASESQREAIELIFDSPICYIWGAPGTGKTRLVLAECVLQYISAGKPVLIVAPTNNALEQTLYGILSVLESAGYKSKLPELVYRIGLPSKEFAAHYPEVCEHFDAAPIEKELEIVSELLCLYYRDRIAAFEAILDEIASLNKRNSELASLYDATKDELQKAKKRFFKKKLVEQKSEELNGIRIEQADISRKLESMPYDEATCSEQIFKYKSKLDNILPKCSIMFSITTFSASHTKYSKYNQLTFEQLSEKLLELETKLKPLEEQIANHLHNSLVVASTVDTYISRLGPNAAGFLPAHVFLDEAAYCPLAKAATLLWYSCPLTLLGDHMQIPPICEIPEKQINQDTFLWAHSALYLQEVFSLSIPELYATYRNNAALPMLPTAFLAHSFRYSNELAEILSDTVYAGSPNRLTGLTTSDTGLFFIDAPKVEGELKTRVSSFEIDAIEHLIKTLPLSDYAVIAPYKKQLAAIENRCQGLSFQSYTIHRAQGREWNTVVFSVVDTTDKFFVSSNNPVSNGLKLINTAVSRAKNKVIFVCDYNYWSEQSDELIGKLLSKSKKWDFSKTLD